MNRLSQDARASLGPAAEEGLKLVFSARAEETEKRLQALRLVVEKQMKDMEELQVSQQARRQAWKKEKADLHQAIDDARHQEYLKKSHEFTNCQADLNAALEELQKATEEHEAMKKEEEESKRILSQPKAPAAAEQELGKNVTSEEASIPEEQVLEEQLQDSTPCPTDVDLQIQMEMEFMRLEKRSVFDRIATRFMKKKEGFAAEFAKKQEEILAAHVKERRKLKEKTRKEMEKTHKAELKEQSKREAKMRTEAKKAAAAEEGRQTRFCFCF
ncbi:GRB10-interacting GYF protein 2-like [Engraulis encrasicolus]|uniref:GRB10-interacting GYF protein 2-like n=1 Tax=Engraulis encrasicolus TaxID=184585 RepID=UPI002FD1F1FA